MRARPDKSHLVRAAALEDLATLEGIAEESRLSLWTHQAYLDEVTRPGSIFLLIETADLGISGFIVGRLVPGPDAEIYNIAVAKKARRHGFGHALLTEFICRCKAEHVENVWLETRQSNANAIKFYMAAGFSKISLRPRFYNDPIEDAVIMKLEL
jgi:ribosomal-protein-alanine N-acetyltransferase